ncbi:lysophospholipid acyltransferase family protein [Caenimonas sp. SL110]|uniref:lysophospholipid acyltransferase family protein n=1 Tax=Caenimonas sp. SL110 TaxID=1450524 RepID=UPI0006546B26|nr:lysophospholipid acyltransferase family protein [Caenimonas sp. SL110]
MKTLFRALSLLPLPVLHVIGTVIGWLSWLASPTYRRRFMANAHQAGYSTREVLGAVAESGKLVTELPRLWFGPPIHVSWEGDEHIRAAQATGKGVVLLTPHLGCFEVAAQSFAVLHGAITVLYRPARKAWLRELVDTARGRGRLATAPTTLAGVRQMLRALKAGEVVGLLPDQVPPEGMGVWAPFFGRDAYTMTLSARLAQQTGATVLLVWAERLSWGRGYTAHVRPFAGELSRDATEAAAQVNTEMENLIRECPQQYLWGYARYKQPRDGAGDVAAGVRP